MEKDIDEILAENARRNAAIAAPFNPVTGLGSTGPRFRAEIPDFPAPVQYLPEDMRSVPLVRELLKKGSVAALARSLGGTPQGAQEDRECIVRQFVRLRCRHDFAFWAALYVYIKNKGGGEDVLFRLTRPQRRFVEWLEERRRAGKPIRLILLKARQWGGSTTSQLYMAWLQLVHRKGLNSLIIAHQGTASDEIKDMFDRAIKAYPVEMLHRAGEAYSPAEPKMEAVGKSGSTFRVPQRNCKIKVGTAERPDSCRGGDYSLVHLSEVGLWRTTDGKRPEDIVRSACSGVLLQPYTMIVYESTANGTGNFFHREYDAAKRGVSQFEAMFVPWFEIEQYALPPDDIRSFAASLYAARDNANVSSTREENGRYLWWLWQSGATLEAVNWYVQERSKYDSHGLMAAEYPSDDIEAFVHSGQMVFDRYRCEELRKSCRPPRLVGDVCADSVRGDGVLANLRFQEDSQGMLSVWDMPEISDDERVTDRYLAVVDVGGYTDRADFSVIVVIDRLFMMDGDPPVVVAQWYGHIDIDLLAWKAAQIAAFYDNALLVIEKNTVDKHDHERQRIDDNYEFILTQLKGQYGNLYARKPSEEDIREGLPKKYGFHTNVATKPMIIETLKMVIRERQYIERDSGCIDEFLVYERKQNGAYGAVAGRHDDRLMTRAIGLRVCFYEMDTPKVVPRVRKPAPRKRKAVSAATI